MLVLGASGRKWTDKDRVLAVALTLYEDGLCGGCGQPRDRAYNPDMEGFYEVPRRVCQACAAVDRARHDDADRKSEPGEKRGVVDASWGEGFTPDPRMLHA